ncbi:signal peptide peptidase SppA [Shewanella sp. 202IG2-18]|uniref:signal peptide peptidase SppA n=1 Tax=Parashewanella hymeniacidonis TaxID=2807618 RepID=UPI00195F8AB9|nr:signal peptide peptidase SppA [Parashewanella hymeniacidonis]MBM7073516.1 signal peptide peptidase SppA [Parashewanella hymeniacidonis]
MSTKKPLTTKNTLKLIWSVINFIRQLVLNIVFFPLLFIGLILAVFALSSDKPITVEDGSALILNLNGQIVDQKHYVDPLEAAIIESKGGAKQSETLLSDVIYVINNAAHDNRIKAIVLDVSGMRGAGISKTEAIGNALAKFKVTGKKIYAVGDYYNQQQYLLASYADKIYLNPQGNVSLEGIGIYRLFYKSALEKLKITTHVYRVGTFKSAVEPYIRDDMSPAAKEANQVLINDLWSSYAKVISTNRNIKAENLVLSPKDYLKELDSVDGDDAKLTVKRKLVDEIATSEQIRLAMIKEFGKADSGHSYNNIDFNDYLSVVKPKHNIILGDAVGIVVAKGTILNGSQQPGNIGGTSTSELLRKARFDSKIKAVVLRVDSPGGSAFASEQIRQQILALKAAGKPVVVSMGSYAASGGYWISASSDYIYATPTTLTGSIGVFGMINTYENAANYLGVHTDGVATSDWPSASVTNGISPTIGKVIQRGVEHNYHNFISLVANERNMSLKDVDKIAQGRVWTGKRALDLGLVDAIGDMTDAVTKASELAKLKSYDTEVIEKELSPEQLFIQELFAQASVYLPETRTKVSLLNKIIGNIDTSLTQLSMFDDPNNIYMLCESCNVQ